MTALLTTLLGRLPIGWLQLLHNRTRLVAAVGGVTFANVLIFMQLGFMNALFETSVLTHRSLHADIVLTSSDLSAFREANPLPRSRMYQALGLPGVRDATPLYMSTIHWTDPVSGDTTNFRILGVNPQDHVFTDPELQARLRTLATSDTALIDTRTRDFLPEIAKNILETGSHEIEVSGRRLNLVGTFAQGASFDVDGTLVVSDQTFLRMFPKRRPGTPTLVLLTTAADAEPESVADTLNSHLPEGDVRALSKSQFIAQEQAYQARQTPIGFVFSFGVVIGLIVGLVIVYQVLATDVQDHLAEYATFKAMGYSNTFFLGIVFEEALSLALLGFLPGLSISLTLYFLAGSATALPIEMTLGRLFLVFSLTVLMCTASGAVATRKLTSADPADLF